MNKITKCILTATSALTLCVTASLMTNKNISRVFANTRPTSMSCGFYFDNNNGYTSLYNLNQMLKNGQIDSNKQYKTWGTVTKSWVYNSNQSTYIQSTDANGNTSSICLYQCDSSISKCPIGSVIEVTAYGEAIKLYNNLPEIQPDTEEVIVEKVYNSNPSPVETFNTTSTWWSDPNNTSNAYWSECYSYGPRQASINGVTITSPNSTYANANFNGSYVYLSYSGSANQSDIYDVFYNAYLNDTALNITGYMQAYSKNSTNRMQLMIRSADDIEEASGGSLKTKTFNSSISVGSYSTGNYGSTTTGGVGFEYYRAVNQSGCITKLLPPTSPYGYTLGGSLYNTSAIKDMRSISLTYSNQNISNPGTATLYYGEHNYESSQTIPYSTSDTTKVFTLPEKTNFFKIETSNRSALYIDSITVEYTGTGSGSFSTYNAYDYYYRANPIKYTGTKVAGSTSVSVPVNYNTNGSTYTVTEYKTYTYYTLDYVENHPSCANDAAMIDPMDVANYFSIFGEIPANYGGSGSGMNDVYDVNYVFGSNTRQVSKYSKTTGYATAIPNVNASSGYYEFDIDVDGTYTTSNRSTGRVVAWIYGINTADYGYGDYAVCHFTDDHYATFEEYNNLGEFLPKFNAERQIAGTIWSQPITITKA